MQNPDPKITHSQQTIFKTIEQFLKGGQTVISYSEIIKQSGYRRTAVINAVKLLNALGLIQISKPSYYKYKNNLPYSYKIIRE